MRVIVITNPAPNVKELITITNDDFVIVVDGALDLLYKQNIKIDLVIGDFDSLRNQRQLKNYEIIKLNKEKDITDTYAAITKAYEISNEVLLLGGIKGERIDHFIANLTLLDKFPNLIILDDNTKISLLKSGSHIITKTRFTSFFAKSEAVITLRGFKYNLDNYILKPFDALGVSNEVVKAYGEINIKHGEIFVIETKEKR